MCIVEINLYKWSLYCDIANKNTPKQIIGTGFATQLQRLVVFASKDDIEFDQFDFHHGYI